MSSFSLPRAKPRLFTPEILKGTPGIQVNSSRIVFRQHCRVLGRMFGSDNHHTRRLREPCLELFRAVESKTMLLDSVRKARLNLVPILSRLAYHERSWIRRPESWIPDLQGKPEAILMSLVDHLFVRRILPGFCYEAWKIDGPIHHVEREWFCHLAAEGSLRGFEGWIPRLTRRAAGYFFEAENPSSMKEAIRYAQVRALTNSPESARAVLSTRMALDFSHDDVWLPFLEMWFRSGHRLGSEFEIVVDYLWAQCQLYGTESVRLRGRTCRTLIRSADSFFSDLRQRFHPHEEGGDWRENADFRIRLLHQQADSWSPLGSVEPFEKEWRGWQWRMEELCSPIELAEEGTDMEHCVGSYAGACRAGRISIFSLRSRALPGGSFDRELTLELDRERRRLRQVRAWRNRRPHSLARRVVLRWCEENEIETGAWSLW